MPDSLAAIALLPRERGLCGVVFRDDARPDRTILGRRIAALCRARGIALAVAGDGRLAAYLGAGLHLRKGRRKAGYPAKGLVTASAHGVAELRAARRNGAAIAFLSPAFATASHPGAAPLGPVRWARLSRGAGLPVLALGGLAGRNIRRLGRSCRGGGAITAVTPL